MDSSLLSTYCISVVQGRSQQAQQHPRPISTPGGILSKSSAAPNADRDRHHRPAEPRLPPSQTPFQISGRRPVGELNNWYPVSLTEAKSNLWLDSSVVEVIVFWLPTQTREEGYFLVFCSSDLWLFNTENMELRFYILADVDCICSAPKIISRCFTWSHLYYIPGMKVLCLLQRRCSTDDILKAHYTVLGWPEPCSWNQL